MVNIDFTPELHAFTYECLLAAQNIKATEARLYNRILDKLEHVAKAKLEPPYFELLDDVKLEFEDSEHFLLSNIIKSIEFTAQGARIAAKSFDTLKINA